MADKKNKKRKKINQDLVFLICFFSVIAMLSLGIAFLNRGTVEHNESGFAGSVQDEEDTENIKRILIVAGIVGAFVIGSAICVKLVKRSEEKAAKNASKKNGSDRPLTEREKKELDEMQKIIALGQKTISSRQYHKGYFGNEDRAGKDETRERPRRRYYDYDDLDDEEEEEGTGRRKLLIPIAIGVGVIAIVAVVVAVIFL
jgi:flagellar basal body-associated protein FliL